MRALALLLLVVSASALEIAGVDFSERDKAAHAGTGFAVSYITAHVLRERTDLGCLPRWLIAAGAGVAVGCAIELQGVYEFEDITATSLGGIGGATAETAVEITCRRDAVALGVAWRF